jgi:hypothetical protein
VWLIEHAKDIAEILALIGTGLFFGYKAYTGYLRVNLSLAVDCLRQRSNDAEIDYLVVTLGLRKGVNGSLTLHDVQARISGEGVDQIHSFGSIERCATNAASSADGRKTIDWSRSNAESPLLKLVPDEETRLSLVCRVPTQSACLVEVAVLGQRTNGIPFGQWKASSVALPIDVPCLGRRDGCNTDGDPATMPIRPT